MCADCSPWLGFCLPSETEEGGKVFLQDYISKGPYSQVFKKDIFPLQTFYILKRQRKNLQSQVYLGNCSKKRESKSLYSCRHLSGASLLEE